MTSLCLHSPCCRAWSELPVFPSCVQATCDYLPLHHSWQPPPSFSEVTYLVIVLHSLKTQAFHSGLCLAFLEKDPFPKLCIWQTWAVKPGYVALLCGSLASQWWLHFLRCLAEMYCSQGKGPIPLHGSILYSPPRRLFTVHPEWRRRSDKGNSHNTL